MISRGLRWYAVNKGQGSIQILWLGYKGPRELGHTRAMLEYNYAEILDEYKDSDKDYSLLKSRA